VQKYFLNNNNYWEQQKTTFSFPRLSVALQKW